MTYPSKEKRAEIGRKTASVAVLGFGLITLMLGVDLTDGSLDFVFGQTGIDLDEYGVPMWQQAAVSGSLGASGIGTAITGIQGWKSSKR